MELLIALYILIGFICSILDNTRHQSDNQAVNLLRGWAIIVLWPFVYKVGE